MHLAAKNRLMPITKLLLNHGADVDARSKSGNTVLLDVSQWGYYEIVDSLIESKADVNATGKNGITALMQASYYGRSSRGHHPYIAPTQSRNQCDISWRTI
mmetsp:Transcript_30025/g.48146  ORF Transcript_30025/g.48146 Transcript_30025/m.48146 type:complete len:101 (+) Transcript_30025:509-811(+)